MRYSRLFFCVSYILSLVSLSACHAAPAPRNSNFNAYMPPSFDSYFENYDYRLAEKNATFEPVSEDWDVSDVDVSFIDPNRKLIAFTFDDSPSKTMENIFAVFASFNEQNPDCRAGATFFFNGGQIDENAMPLVYTANMMGFELGNHTQSHFDLTELSETELRSEIDQTDEILARVDGKSRHLLRAPFGRINDFIKSHVSTPIIDWTIDTLDWTGASEESIFDTVFSLRFSGAIALMHDGYPATVDALKRLLPALKEDGYQVVSVSALAKMHNCALKRGSVYIRARKRNNDGTMYEVK